jgi:hypothetical protein
MTASSFTILADKMARDPSGHTRRMYLAKCVCGDTRWRSAQHISTGASRACRSCANKTHGNSASPEYRCWYHMRHRCFNKTNPAYKDYGGRGISVDPTWDSFDVFLRDMGARPEGATLERKDNSLGYSKDNCVWASRQEQSINRRNTRWVTYAGKTQHLAAWSRELGIRQDTLTYRLNHGWSVERAFETGVTRD